MVFAGGAPGKAVEAMLEMIGLRWEQEMPPLQKVGAKRGVGAKRPVPGHRPASGVWTMLPTGEQHFHWMAADIVGAEKKGMEWVEGAVEHQQSGHGIRRLGVNKD